MQLREAIQELDKEKQLICLEIELELSKGCLAAKEHTMERAREVWADVMANWLSLQMSTIDYNIKLIQEEIKVLTNPEELWMN